MMQKTVAFTLAPALTERNRIPVSRLLEDIKRDFEAAGLSASEIKLSSLGYGGFGIPISSGRIGVSVWPDRYSDSSWQIWIRYSQSWLKKLFHARLPDDLDKYLERTRQAVEEFLVAHRAKNVQWISVKEAHKRLPP
jgi:hypothetical protein